MVISLITVSVVAVLAILLAGFQAWYFPKKNKEMVDLFMVREAKALERLNRRAKEAKDNAVKKTPEKSAPHIVSGNGNRRFR